MASILTIHEAPAMERGEAPECFAFNGNVMLRPDNSPGVILADTFTSLSTAEEHQARWEEKPWLEGDRPIPGTLHFVPDGVPFRVSADATPSPASVPVVKWPDRQAGTSVWQDGFNSALSACRAAYDAARLDASKPEEPSDARKEGA